MSDWSSDVCSSVLGVGVDDLEVVAQLQVGELCGQHLRGDGGGGVALGPGRDAPVEHQRAGGDGELDAELGDPLVGGEGLADVGDDVRIRGAVRVAHRAVSIRGWTTSNREVTAAVGTTGTEERRGGKECGQAGKT